ncbi:MAG: DoxX family protein [Acidimicrobiales bacterium]
MTATEFDVVMLAFRVFIGLTFAYHGWAKRFSGGGIAGTAGWFESIGMRPGTLHANVAWSVEILTGVGLAVGLLTPFAAAGMIGIMVVAAWAVHRRNGFAIVKDGWEYNAVVAVVAAAIAGLGPGEWSLDAAFGLADALNGFTGLAIAVVLGVVTGALQLAVFFRPPPA